MFINKINDLIYINSNDTWYCYNKTQNMGKYDFRKVHLFKFI